MDMKECVDNILKQYETDSKRLEVYSQQSKKEMLNALLDDDLEKKISEVNRILTELSKVTQPLYDFYNFIESCQKQKDEFNKWNSLVEQDMKKMRKLLNPDKNIWTKFKETFTQ